MQSPSLRASVLLLAAALLFGSAPASAQGQPSGQRGPATAEISQAPQLQPVSDAAGNETYVLDTGDKIHVTVFGKDNENLGGDFEVDGTGLIRLPLLGPTRAGGLTALALEESITQALAAGYLINPRVNVSVTTYRPFFILGEVTKPGSYPYANNMNALNAIAMAGGYTTRAVTSKILIRHQGETVEREYPADQSTQIRPGDIVRVSDTVFWRFMSYALPVLAIRPY